MQATLERIGEGVTRLKLIVGVFDELERLPSDQHALVSRQGDWLFVTLHILSRAQTGFLRDTLPTTSWMSPPRGGQTGF